MTTVPLSLAKLIAGQPRFMSEHGFEVTLISSPGEGTDEIERREGCSHVPLSMTRRISPLRDAVALLKLTKLFRRIRPTIVHTHTPKAGLLGMVAARLSNVPIRIHTVAGLPLMEARGPRRRILKFTERATSRCATHVLPNSRVLAEYLTSERLCDPVKIKVIGSGSSNGIDCEYFRLDDRLRERAAELRRSLGLGPADFVFVFIGRVVKDKGIDELVEAFSTLAGRCSNARLLIVGPTEEHLDPIGANSLETLRQSAAVRMAGYQDDVRPFLAASDVLVLPSYREGFPNVPMQAGCLGVPSIVSDINGCNEIVRDGINGLLVPPKDARQLQIAMERVLSDPALLELLKSNARSEIVDRFEQRSFWRLLLEQYRLALEQYGKSAPDKLNPG